MLAVTSPGTVPRMDFSHFVQRPPPQGQRFASKQHGGKFFAADKNIAAPYYTVRRYF